MTYEPTAANLAVELTRLSVEQRPPGRSGGPGRAHRARPGSPLPGCGWPAACAPSPAGSSPARAKVCQPS